MSDRAALARHAARFQRPPFVPDAPDNVVPLWEAATFHLEDLRAFRDAQENVRNAILTACAHNVLAEAWGVEQCGIAYCAAMAHQAESPQQRDLFVQIGTDEAQHAG